MFPGIDGFHWTVGHVIFLSLFFAPGATFAPTRQSSCAGSRTLRNYRNPIGAAAMNWRAEWCRELATTLSIVAGAGNTPSLPCCLLPD
jgi:hypothetical protein